MARTRQCAAERPCRHDQQRNRERGEHAVAATDALREQSKDDRANDCADVVEHRDVSDGVGRDAMSVFQEVGIEILGAVRQAVHQEHQNDHVQR